MREGWVKYTLGELCDLTKGRTPTQKASPGRYPLVVTAEGRASSDTYQFDVPAVCVPMVSSTGHGHASLKRVHYQEGQFAVANIITACTAKPGAPVDMRFLWLLLDHRRNELIVPLMKGTANVSLSQKALATVSIALPPPAEQQRIVNLIGAVDDAIRQADVAARTASTSAVQCTQYQLSRMEASQGTLGDLAQWFSGGTPKAGDPQYYEGGTIPWAVIADVQDVPIRDTLKKITPAGVRKIGRTAPAGSVLVTMYGTIGRSALVETEMATNQAIAWGVPNEGVDARFLFAYLRLNASRLDALGRGATQRNINRAIIKAFPVPLLSASQQEELVEAFEAFDKVVQLQRNLATALRSLRSNLLTALLSGEHEIPLSYDELMEVVS